MRSLQQNYAENCTGIDISVTVGGTTINKEIVCIVRVATEDGGAGILCFPIVYLPALVCLGKTVEKEVTAAISVGRR